MVCAALLFGLGNVRKSSKTAHKLRSNEGIYLFTRVVLTFFQTESVAQERLAQQFENHIQKSSIPVFEKPVIIRPKSTSDLIKLRKQTNEILPRIDAHLNLHIEQDLEKVDGKNTLEEERDFELWADELHVELEQTALERYTYVHMETPH